MSDRAKLPTIGPLLWYRDPRAAIAWLEAAFGFETRLIVDDGKGGVIHSELTLGAATSWWSGRRKAGP